MVIKVKNLIKKFEEKVVLDNFNLELKENDILNNFDILYFRINTLW